MALKAQNLNFRLNFLGSKIRFQPITQLAIKFASFRYQLSVAKRVSSQLPVKILSNYQLYLCWVLSWERRSNFSSEILSGCIN